MPTSRPIALPSIRATTWPSLAAPEDVSPETDLEAEVPGRERGVLGREGLAEKGMTGGGRGDRWSSDAKRGRGCMRADVDRRAPANRSATR